MPYQPAWSGTTGGYSNGQSQGGYRLLHWDRIPCSASLWIIFALGWILVNGNPCEERRDICQYSHAFAGDMSTAALHNKIRALRGSSTSSCTDIFTISLRMQSNRIHEGYLKTDALKEMDAPTATSPSHTRGPALHWFRDRNLV